MADSSDSLDDIFSTDTSFDVSSGEVLDLETVGDANPTSTGDDSTAPPADGEKSHGEKDTDDSDEAPSRTVPYAAIKSERARRKEAEARLEHYEREIAAYKQAQRAPAVPPGPPVDPDEEFFKDPRGWYENRIAEVENKFSTQIVQHRVQASADLVRQQVADYDEVVQLYKDAASKDPSLYDDLRSQSNPARYAYDYGKALQIYLDPESASEQMRAQMREELLEELRAKGFDSEPAVAIPKTTARARNARSGAMPADDDDSLRSIFARR